MTAVRVTSLTESPAIPIEMTAATPATPATSISHWRLEQGFNWAIFAAVVVVVVVAVAAVASFHFHLTRWCPLARLNRWLKAPGARLLFRRRRIVNMAIMAPIIQTGIWGGREGGGRDEVNRCLCGAAARTADRRWWIVDHSAIYRRRHQRLLTFDVPVDQLINRPRFNGTQLPSLMIFWTFFVFCFIGFAGIKWRSLINSRLTWIIINWVEFFCRCGVVGLLRRLRRGVAIEASVLTVWVTRKKRVKCSYGPILRLRGEGEEEEEEEEEVKPPGTSPEQLFRWRRRRRRRREEGGGGGKWLLEELLLSAPAPSTDMKSSWRRRESADGRLRIWLRGDGGAARGVEPTHPVGFTPISARSLVNWDGNETEAAIGHLSTRGGSNQTPGGQGTLEEAGGGRRRQEEAGGGRRREEEAGGGKRRPRQRS